MKVTLNKRLQAVASFVSNDATLADIGSDHAFLPCYLVNEGIIQKAYAGEVIEGPLNQSKKSINEYNLEDKVFPVLSDGLANIPSDVTEITIAGMGAYTILEILNAYPEKVKSYSKIIIQSNSHMELIREYISNHLFTIIDESVVYDKGKYYEICVFNPSLGRELSEDEIMFGPILSMKREKVVRDYFLNNLRIKQNILKNIDESHIKYVNVVNEVEKLNEIVKR